MNLLKFAVNNILIANQYIEYSMSSYSSKKNWWCRLVAKFGSTQHKPQYLKTTNLKTSNLKTSNLKNSNLKTSNLKTSNLKPENLNFGGSL